MQDIRVWENVDYERFHNEIIPLNQPAIIRAIVSDWPTVEAAKKSPEAVVNYLKPMDTRSVIPALVGTPDINGRFFYSEDLTEHNFQRAEVTLSIGLDRLLAIKDRSNPHAIALQAIQLNRVMPDYKAAHPQPLLDNSAEPTMWVGNQATVAPHYDIHDNLACVVAGKRKFTLFPPEQINNLYPGPTLSAPAGVPVSMVDMKNPDYKSYPKYKEAVKAAFQATLEPGDGIFIPALWWHGVESLETFNILVNYWWGGNMQGDLSPNDSLLHSMMSIANLDQNKREAWQHFFNYYVFKTKDNPSDHLPSKLRDIVTELSPEQQLKVRNFLAEKLK
ncbi:MAG: cupin-like domain-containing protein [Porticoccaceae bacterium]